jgi:hypothetical protein
MLNLLIHIVPFALTSINVPAVLITILLLKSRQGLPKALAYVEGIALFYVVFSLLATVAINQVPGSSDPPTALRSILYAGVGAFLVFVAVRLYKSRDADATPAPVQESTEGKPGKLRSRFMQAPEKLGPRLLFALGFVMALTGVKNLVLFTAGMVDISTQPLTLLYKLIAIAVLIAALIWWEVAPIAVYTVVPHRADSLLDWMTAWMKRNQRLVIAGLCLIVGVKMVIEGVVDLITLFMIRLPR